MYKYTDSPYLVPFDDSFSWKDAPTSPPDDVPGKKELKRQLKETVKELDELQRRLYAQNQHAVLLIFQALDAAGKDSTIRAVMRGINPAGCEVFSFKQPSAEELDHDFLWRTSCRLPERGRIGVFNRSYYEEVLVVRVHPEYLNNQQLPRQFDDLGELWNERYDAIRNHEKHLAQSGTAVLKFWLHVSKEEQRQRFLSRIDEPEKNWKFSDSDVEERKYWDHYMQAYNDALRATSRPWAPWYAIPADNKPYMRACVARIVAERLKTLQLNYPHLSDEALADFKHLEEKLTQD